MRSMAFDVNGATVRGPGNLQFKGCRALWHEGTLYIVTSPSNVVSYPAAAEPRRAGAMAQVTTDAGQILTIQKPGCNCKKKPELGAMTLEQIVGLVPADV